MAVIERFLSSIRNPKTKQIYEDFFWSIKSTKTKETYLNYIRYFSEHVKIQLEDLLKLSTKDIERKIIDYVIHMRTKGLSYSSMRGRISPIVAFLDLNDVVVNRLKIERFFGEHIIKKDLAYSMDDIQTMCSMATFRTKLIILIFSSTGIRREALIKLQLRHIKKIEEFNLYRFTIYENTKDEYITFTTSECASMIDQYLNHRRNSGEKLTPECYLIRNHFDSKDPQRVKNASPVTGQDLNTIFVNLLKNTGLRQSKHGARYERHEKAIFNAFRKFWNTALVKANVNQLVKEKLMGHSIGLDDSYLRLDEDKILSEYLKAIDLLTVDPANRLKRKVKVLEEEKSKIDLMKLKYEKDMKEMREEMEHKLSKILAKIDLKKLK